MEIPIDTALAQRLVSDFAIPYFDVVAEDVFLLAQISAPLSETWVDCTVAALAHASKMSIAETGAMLEQIASHSQNVLLHPDSFNGQQPWNKLLDVDISPPVGQKQLFSPSWFYDLDPHVWYEEACQNGTRDCFISEDGRKAFGAAMFFRSRGVQAHAVAGGWAALLDTNG